MRKLVIVLGVPIDDLTMDEAIDRIDHFVVEGRATGKSAQVATVNADFVVKSLADPELRQLLREADMCTADGMPLVWGARLLGVPLSGRVTGADMVPRLARRAAERGYSIYLLGAAPGIAERAARVMCGDNPGLTIAGIDVPPFGPILDMDPAVGGGGGGGRSEDPTGRPPPPPPPPGRTSCWSRSATPSRRSGSPCTAGALGCP
jgi:N-acetylglucosaminyldiphosphoundecaprenol N-acetyl-beta-D-mannosaminyltransferase